MGSTVIALTWHVVRPTDDEPVTFTARCAPRYKGAVRAILSRKG